MFILGLLSTLWLMVSPKTSFLITNKVYFLYIIELFYSFIEFDLPMYLVLMSLMIRVWSLVINLMVKRWSNYAWWMKDSTHKSDFDTKMKNIPRTGTQNVLVWTGLPCFTLTRFQTSSVDLQRSYQFLWIGWSGVFMNTQEHAQPRRIEWTLVPNCTAIERKIT